GPSLTGEICPLTRWLALAMRRGRQTAENRTLTPIVNPISYGERHGILTPKVGLDCVRTSDPHCRLVGFSPREALDQPESERACPVRVEVRGLADLCRAAGGKGTPNERARHHL